jgi:hypothetical protein
VSQAWKQSRLQDFSNQNENKGMFSFKSRSWNKKNNNNNITSANKNPIIFYYKKNKNKMLWQENIPKIDVK